nr:MAG TPA: hypothetical protein [Caudoviricetes sp.]DAO28904.1 MAG TPA: hypothetical protein [Caudoviricetes sp.]DAO30389.1 MAG TPA: hypothetical protein [Caudoviricetes sp.]
MYRINLILQGVPPCRNTKLNFTTKPMEPNRPRISF